MAAPALTHIILPLNVWGNLGLKTLLPSCPDPHTPSPTHPCTRARTRAHTAHSSTSVFSSIFATLLQFLGCSWQPAGLGIHKNCISVEVSVDKSHGSRFLGQRASQSLPPLAWAPDGPGIYSQPRWSRVSAWRRHPGEGSQGLEGTQLKFL